MNVLLVSPEFPDTFWSFRHALKFVRKRAPYPPLGLLTVAAMLPAEWRPRLLDTNVEPLTSRDLEWADIVFIGGMVVQRESALELARRCHAAGLPIVAGGPLFTSEPETFPDVDHFVLGEAEVTLPAFLRDWSAGRAQRFYRATEYADLSRTPVPRWDLLDFRQYASMSIQFSRGCPFNCEFCNVTALFGHRPRIKTLAQITAELDSLWELGWRSTIFFVDDNLIGHKKSLRNELLPGLISWQRARGRRIPFCTEVSINLADDEKLMADMAEAGFDAVFIGIESPSEESLEECGKSQNRRRDLLADVKRIQRAGIQVQGGFIVGFDHDTETIFQRQIEFIQNSGIVTAMVGLLQAPMGTRLYERMRRENRILGRLSGDNVDGTTNIIPTMSLETLKEGYETVLRHIYAPKHYYARIRTFLREVRPPEMRPPLRREELLAGLRSILHLGIVGRERVEYWRLVVWTLFRRPRMLPLAITLSIYGHHFRRIAEAQRP